MGLKAIVSVCDSIQSGAEVIQMSLGIHAVLYAEISAYKECAYFL